MRDRILAVALQLMNAYGIKFTTSDLARDLGVSKRAVYEHFDSKEALMAAIFDNIRTDFRLQIATILQGDDLDITDKLKALMVFSPKALGPLNEKMINDTKRFLPQEWAKFEAYFQERWEMIEQVISQGVNKGILEPVDLAVLRKMYLGTIDKLLDYHFLVENDTTFRNAMTKAADIMIRGLTVCQQRPPAKAETLLPPTDS
ncbi:TetR/AcrR family transcriptional regulator [Anaeroselena agilis]|uniref:TetR/AcrR family transcriptional regulator n=1 Tax=Anaeroselena agilis TaxID=3063788 RepID=A0ABU3NSM9_9FIRM|nr:TetR/AcrR family transcriptional regulator [Selenomonadales bacterium 4137-cl]